MEKYAAGAETDTEEHADRISERERDEEDDDDMEIMCLDDIPNNDFVEMDSPHHSDHSTVRVL